MGEEQVLHEDLSFKELPYKTRQEMEHNQTEKEGVQGILSCLLFL